MKNGGKTDGTEGRTKQIENCCQNRKKSKTHWYTRVLDYGAGDRTRTGTPSLAVDFESTTSTISSHRQMLQ